MKLTRFSNKFIKLTMMGFVIITTLFMTACGTKKSTINFMVDGNIYETVQVKGNTFLLPENPTKENHHFSGWYIDENVWEVPFDALFDVNNLSKEGLTVYSKFEPISALGPTDVFISGGKESEIEGIKIVELVVRDDVTSLDFNELVNVHPTSTWFLTFDENGNDSIVDKILTLEKGENRVYLMVRSKELVRQKYTIIVKQLERFNVFFNSNGGTKLDTQTVLENELALIPQTPIRRGYDFAGWDYDFNTPITREITISAKWTPKTYTINFILNGGVLAETQQIVNFGETYNLPTPTKPGHSFSGWFKNDILIKDGIYTEISDVTLEAKWDIKTHVVKFIVGDLLEVIELQEGAIPSPTVETVKPANQAYHYQFIGWDKVFEPVMEPTIYEALFQAVPHLYNVDYVLNGGQNDPNNPVVHGIETNFTLLEASKNGYTFDGWYLDSEFTVKMESLNGLTENLVLYAKFTINSYEINFLSEDGQTVLETQNILYGETPKPSNTPYKETTVEYTYTFNGWDKPIQPASKDMNYLATFKAVPNPFTITWVIDGIETKKVYGFNEPVEAMSLPSKDNYTFVGWSIEIPLKMPASDLTITALFELNSYEIKFYDEDGLTLLETLTVNAFVVPTPLSVPSKADSTSYHYQFIGWDQPLVEATENMSYKAVYQVSPVDYLIYYELDGGLNNTLNPNYHNIESNIELKDPSKEGYTFKGWFLDDLFTQPINHINGLTKDLTLYASFEINVYDLTLSEGLTASTALTKIEYGTEVIITINYDNETHFFVGLSVNNVEVELTSIAPGDTYTFIMKETTKITLHTIAAGKQSVTFLLEDNSIYLISEVFNGTQAIAPIAPTKEGYTFIGWYLNDQLYDFNNLITDNISLSARFVVNTYEVIFYDESGANILETLTVEYGTIPAATVTPVKASTAEYSYSFNGWDRTLIPATENTVYYATFASTPINYTITYLVDGIQIGDVDIVGYNGLIVLREPPLKKGYRFTGWQNSYHLMPAHDIVIEGLFEINTYTITWVIEGHETVVPYEFNATIKLPDNPIKVGHTFNHWDQEVPVKMPDNNLMFMAVFTVNMYQITWIIGDQTIISEVNYNEMIIEPSNPTQTGYTFIGWDKALPNAMPANDLIFTALWDIAEYQITFVDDEGVVLETLFVKHNETPTPKTPSKESKAYTYIFVRWTPEIVPATQNTTYQAYFQKTPIFYNITYILNGGTNHTDNPRNYYYDSNVVLKPATKTGQTFGGWFLEPTFDTQITELTQRTGDLVLYAKYETRVYEIVFYAEDHVTVLQTLQVVHGNMPQPTITPTKTPTQEYTYQFKGWNPILEIATQNASYYAEFEPILIERIDFDYQIVNDLLSFGNSQKNLVDSNLRRSDYLRENMFPLNYTRANLWTYSAYFTMINRAYLVDPTQQNYDLLIKAYNELDWYRSTERSDGHLVYASQGGKEKPAFYDDNIWIVVGFLNGYQATGNQDWLQKAKDLMAWIYTGWSTQGNPIGGIYWREYEASVPPEERGRNTCINGPAAWASLMLYEITNDPFYFNWGKQIYHWTKTWLLDEPTKLYNDNINDIGQVNGWKFSYNTGTMISAASMLYSVSIGAEKETYKQDVQDLIWGSTQYGLDQNHPHSFTKMYSDIPNAFFYKDNPWFRVYLFQGYYDAMTKVNVSYGWPLEKVKNGLIHARRNNLFTSNFINEDWSGKTSNENKYIRTLNAVGNTESIYILEAYQKYLIEFSNSH